MKAKLARNSGFTLVEVMIVVAIIGLLSAVAVPNFVKAREASHKNICIANLKQIEAAISAWGIDSSKGSASPIDRAELFGATKYIIDEPRCPATGNIYTLGATIGTTPQVSCDSGIPDHAL